MRTINQDTWCTYQLGCSKECWVCLTGAVCSCPCPRPGSQGSHSVGSVCSATRGGGVSQQHGKIIRCKSVYILLTVVAQPLSPEITLRALLFRDGIFSVLQKEEIPLRKDISSPEKHIMSDLSLFCLLCNLMWHVVHHLQRCYSR